jgi:serine/threonine protein kinase
MESGNGEHRWLGGRYELGELIGEGGMSTVYRSYDHHMARAVAVKVFHPGAEIADGDERFRREVLLLAGLRDPGIVTVFDAELDVAAPYLVTELVEGPTLLQRIRQVPVSEAQVIQLAAALAHTLAYVHARGVVHRDVKPSNILLPSIIDDPFAAAKLVDFGIAIAAGVSRLTAVNLTVGTANYLSPEQLRAEPLTPATDIYSLGLVLIEALTGEPAYPHTGLEATMARLDHRPAIPAVASPSLRAAISDMTAADPQDRPGAAQLANRLDELKSSRTTQLPHRGAGASTELPARTAAHVARRAHRRPRRPNTIAAAALGIAALTGAAAAAGLIITHRPGRPAQQAPPGYAAPTTGTAAGRTHAATAGPHPPTAASGPQQVADPASPTAASATASRPPTTSSGNHPTPPKTASVSAASPSTSPASASSSTLPATPTPTSTPSSDPGSPSTAESPSDPGSPSAPSTSTPSSSPTP